MVGYQQYRPDADKTKSNDPKLGRYYTHSRGNKEINVVGGLESYAENDVLFVVEGLFDAVPIWNAGFPCIWTCGLPSSPVQHWIRNLRNPTVAILDPQGKNSDKDYRKMNNNFNCCDLVIKPSDYGIDTDLGDMNERQVTSIVIKSLIELEKMGLY